MLSKHSFFFQSPETREGSTAKSFLASETLVLLVRLVLLLLGLGKNVQNISIQDTLK